LFIKLRYDFSLVYTKFAYSATNYGYSATNSSFSRKIVGELSQNGKGRAKPGIIQF